MKSFEAKTVVITGGANGVGRALGIAFAAARANVVLVDIHSDNLDATIAELALDNISGMQADVTDPASMEALAARCFETHGCVHVLVNNAGVGLGEATRPMWTLPPKDWDWGLAVNTLGPVNGIRAFVPRMVQSGEECVVVNTSSGNGGLTSLPTTPIYAASKAALTSLTEVLQLQLVKAGRRSARRSCTRVRTWSTPTFSTRVTVAPRSSRRRQAASRRPTVPWPISRRAAGWASR